MRGSGQVSPTLARDYGIAATFGVTQTICTERPIEGGESVEFLGADGNPFIATVGLRVEPAPQRSGVRYVRELGSLPLAFYRAIEETIHETFKQGLSGWEVADCVVTLTHAGFDSVTSTASDFRKLVPLVLMRALQGAGTTICEPFETIEIEIPEDTFGAVSGALVHARATLGNAFRDGASYRVLAEIPTVELRALEQQLPSLTRGEGGWLSTFAGYVPIYGDAPVRTRIGTNPLNRAQYLADVARG